MKLLLAILLTLSSVATCAMSFAQEEARPNRCEELLSLPLEISKTPALTEEDRAFIQTIFEQEIPASERIHQAYEYYISQRLNQMPSEMSQELEGYVFDLGFEFYRITSDEHQGLELPLDATTDKVALPSEFEELPLIWILLAHEHEHRIQIFSVNHSTNLKAWTLKTVDRHLPLWRYSAEVRAMQAEWEFMSVIPQNLIDSNLDLLKDKIRQGSLNQGAYMIFAGMLLDAHLSREDYIKSQHSRGRYSVGGFVKSAALPWAGYGIGLFGLSQLYGLFN